MFIPMYPPSVNEKTTVVRTKSGRYVPVNKSSYTKFKKEFGAMYKQMGGPCFKEPEILQMDLILYPPSALTDYDNGLKPIGDSLQYNKVIYNDAFIYRVSVVKHIPCEKVGVDITLSKTTNMKGIND